MCTTVYLPQPDGPGKSARRIGELRDLLGVEPVVLKGYGELPDRCCLCPCDVEATAKLAGYSCENYDESGDCDLRPNA